jgi:pentachlorophenol monooxygenase/3-(3-hydroxy-phenyl)propionate hydroxylase
MSVLVAARETEDEMATTLGAKPGEAWVVRPDAFVAAVVDASDPVAVQTAVNRASGRV